MKIAQDLLNFFLFSDDKIEQMITELNILRGQLTKIQKKFSIYLTSYHKIDEHVVTVSGNSINFKGIFHFIIVFRENMIELTNESQTLFSFETRF